MNSIFGQRSTRHPFSPQTAFRELAPQIKIFPACSCVIVPSDSGPRGFGDKSHRIDIVAEYKPQRLPVSPASQLLNCAKGFDEGVGKSRITGLCSLQARSRTAWQQPVISVEWQYESRFRSVEAHVARKPKARISVVAEN